MIMKAISTDPCSLGAPSYYFESRQIEYKSINLAAQAAKHFNNPENEAAFLGDVNRHCKFILLNF